MRCPECGAVKSARPKKGPHAWRQPVEKNGKTWRVHECANCRKIFISVQTALTPRDAGAWAEAFEPPILPEIGLTPKLVSEDSPLRRLVVEPAS